MRAALALILLCTACAHEPARLETCVEVTENSHPCVDGPNGTALPGYEALCARAAAQLERERVERERAQKPMPFSTITLSTMPECMPPNFVTCTPITDTETICACGPLPPPSNATTP